MFTFSKLAPPYGFCRLCKACAIIITMVIAGTSYILNSSPAQAASGAGVAPGAPFGASGRSTTPPASEKTAVPAIESEENSNAANQAAGAAVNQRDSTTINQFMTNPANQPDQGNNQGNSVDGNSEKPNSKTMNNAQLPGKRSKFKFSPKLLVTGPERLLKACPGFMLGTPIATTKKVIEESKQATIDLAGDNRNPFILSVLGVLGVPAGILSGGTEGPAMAAVNGWKYADQKPFSKEYFSLGDNGQPPGQ